MPPDAKHIERSTAAFRSDLERKLRELLPQDESDLSPLHVALVHSAVQHESIAQLAHKRLRGLNPAAPTAEHVQLWSVISKETDARDRCIKALGIDAIDARGFDPAAAIAAARFRALSADDEAGDDEAPQSPASDAGDHATETPRNNAGGHCDAP